MWIPTWSAKAEQGNYPIDGRLQDVFGAIRNGEFSKGEPDAHEEFCRIIQWEPLVNRIHASTNVDLTMLSESEYKQNKCVFVCPEGSETYSVPNCPSLLPLVRPSCIVVVFRDYSALMRGNCVCIRERKRDRQR